MSKVEPPESNRDIDLRLQKLAAEMNVSTLNLLRGVQGLTGPSPSSSSLINLLSLVASPRDEMLVTLDEIPQQLGPVDDGIRLAV